jgi:hypothetical protein
LVGVSLIEYLPGQSLRCRRRLLCCGGDSDRSFANAPIEVVDPSMVYGGSCSSDPSGVRNFTTTASPPKLVLSFGLSGGVTSSAALSRYRRASTRMTRTKCRCRALVEARCDGDVAPAASAIVGTSALRDGFRGRHRGADACGCQRDFRALGN